MSYNKQTWDTTSYVNPTRMNHIENGIEEVSNAIANLNATNIPYDSNTSVKEKIDSLEWKYAGTLDMASPPSGAFDWTATESGTDFANAKEIMLMITMAISGIEYPRTTTISLVNGVNSPIGVDVGFSSAGRIYALGTIKNTTQLSFIGASNGGLASKIKIYWK